MNVFARYAPFIRDYIYRSNWQALRGVQNAAGEAIFSTEENVLLTASTASGKTEAAFFPILSLFDRDMHAGLYGYEPRLGTGELADFISLEYSRIGADQNITPREVIRDFIELMDLLYQNPALTMSALLDSDAFSYARSEAVSDQADESFAEFEI